MKTFIFSLLALIAVTAWAAPEPDAAPFINKQIKEITAKVASDLASGTLSKSDADELDRRVDHVKKIEASEPMLTPKTRRDMREDLSAIIHDLTLKEGTAKADASASPTP